MIDPGLDCVLDAAGPDTFSFGEMVGLLASAMGVRARLVGLLMRDEMGRLIGGLLTSGE